MSLLILLITHLVAAGIGAWITYALTCRYTKVVEVDGHKAIEFIHDDGTHDEEGTMSLSNSPRWPAVLTLIISVAMVIIGVQIFVANQQKDARDARDRAYANCLADFASDLVETIEARTNAGTKVELAAERRDDAVDDVLRITALARKEPPKATVEDFDRALKEAVRAKKDLRRVRKAAAEVRQDNQYTAPEIVCDR